MKKALLLAAIVFGVFYSAMAETHDMDKGVPIQFGWNDTSFLKVKFVFLMSC